jgi:phospholipase C
MANGMKGFAENYAATRVTDDPGEVLRYQTKANVPVYHWLSERYAFGDRWFCSIPGSTWPNRLASLTGYADDKDNKLPPIYDQLSFVTGLDHERYTWGWYSSDPGSLRLADSNYRTGWHENFAYVEKPSLIQPRTLYTDLFDEDEFPNVAWIDPNFVDLGGLHGADDDHPPTDVMAGQSFVLKIYETLAKSAIWKKSLLVVVYDEHGGFYDHVDPSAGLPDWFAKRSQYAHFGPRVPALFVSPFVEPGTCFGSSQAEAGDTAYCFDHTALIKTILLRFGKQQGRYDSTPRFASGSRRAATSATCSRLIRRCPRRRCPTTTRSSSR